MFAEQESLRFQSGPFSSQILSRKIRIRACLREIARSKTHGFDHSSKRSPPICQPPPAILPSTSPPDLLRLPPPHQNRFPQKLPRGPILPLKNYTLAPPTLPPNPAFPGDLPCSRRPPLGRVSTHQLPFVARAVCDTNRQMPATRSRHHRQRLVRSAEFPLQVADTGVSHEHRGEFDSLPWTPSSS